MTSRFGAQPAKGLARRLRLSVAQLSVLTEFSQSRIARTLSGYTRSPDPVLSAIARVLHRSEAELFTPAYLAARPRGASAPLACVPRTVERRDEDQDLLAALRPALRLADKFRYAAASTGAAVLIVPPTFPDVTVLYGLKVVRGDVHRPLVAFDPEPPPTAVH